MAGFFSRLFGGRPAARLRDAMRLVGGSGFVKQERVSERRFEAAETDRLNDRHWRKAHDFPLNRDLFYHLKILRGRCAYECENNGILKGCIRTYLNCVVGARGPVLQVLSGDKAKAKRIERAWKRWAKRPDMAGRCSLASMLRLWLRCAIRDGEFLAQLVTDVDGDGPVKLRVHSIDVRRLDTPAGRVGDSSVVLGVRRNRFGKPLEYFVQQSDEGVLGGYGTEFDALPARDVVHGFVSEDAGQVRGIPWLASVLQDIADLRDYDVQVLDAARAAADYGVYLYSEHPGLEPQELSDSDVVEIERRMVVNCPAGWKPMSLQSNQPAVNYVEYRKSRYRDVGRPLCMPLMLILLDASGHNYSSARFDAQMFWQAIAETQALLEEWVVDRLFGLFLREFVMAHVDEFGVGFEEEVDWMWVWPTQPHVDPVKESTAEGQLMKNKTLTFAGACAGHGQDWEDVLEQLGREKASFEEAGVPWPGDGDAAKPGDSDEKDGDEEQDRGLRGMVERVLVGN